MYVICCSWWDLKSRLLFDAISIFKGSESCDFKAHMKNYVRLQSYWFQLVFERILMEMLPTLEKDYKPGDKAEASVVWLHGLGADGNDFAPIVPQLNLSLDFGVRFVFPHAPSQRPPDRTRCFLDPNHLADCAICARLLDVSLRLVRNCETTISCASPTERVSMSWLVRARFDCKKQQSRLPK